MLKTRPLKMVLKLNFSDGCGCQFTSINFPINFQASRDSINQDKSIVIQKLRDMSIQDQSCGQFSMVERKILPGLQKEITIYAVATNIVGYGAFPTSSGLSEVNLQGKEERRKVNYGSNGYFVPKHEILNAAEGPTKKLKVC
ncbi:unnamed protein product [Ilex paraguariensis]|uniref:Uncharacterized protein n=1 Tax=Ilex paraguariensis TaxID=185542 RepID=A0ABC8S3R8_9AQUA